MTIKYYNKILMLTQIYILIIALSKIFYIFFIKILLIIENMIRLLIIDYQKHHFQ